MNRTIHFIVRFAVFALFPPWNAWAESPSAEAETDRLFGEVKPLMEQGRHEDALDAVNRAIDLNPVAEGFAVRASVLLEMERIPAAAADADEAIRRGDRSSLPYVIRDVCSEQMGDPNHSLSPGRSRFESRGRIGPERGSLPTASAMPSKA